MWDEVVATAVVQRTHEHPVYIRGSHMINFPVFYVSGVFRSAFDPRAENGGEKTPALCRAVRCLPQGSRKDGDGVLSRMGGSRSSKQPNLRLLRRHERQSFRLR